MSEETEYVELKRYVRELEDALCMMADELGIPERFDELWDRVLLSRSKRDASGTDAGYRPEVKRIIHLSIDSDGRVEHLPVDVKELDRLDRPTAQPPQGDA